MKTKHLGRCAIIVTMTLLLSLICDRLFANSWVFPDSDDNGNENGYGNPGVAVINFQGIPDTIYDLTDPDIGSPDYDTFWQLGVRISGVFGYITDPTTLRFNFDPDSITATNTSLFWESATPVAYGDEVHVMAYGAVVSTVTVTTSPTYGLGQNFTVITFNAEPYYIE